MHYAPHRMHIPDGFLSAPVAMVGWGLAIILLALALRATRRSLGERQVPLMGVMAAFIFAAQAINFPVAAGTSGHLLGGALAAIVLGPWPATLVMTAVIAIQALVFQDGGLLAMGWNILNMGAFTAIGGWVVYQLLGGEGRERTRRGWFTAFAAAWCSVELGAIATSIELAVSGASPFGLVLPAMAGVHALIGVGEGLITAAAVAFLAQVRPAAFQFAAESPARVPSAETVPGAASARLMLLGLLAALIVALFSPLASPHPDGLEFVAEAKGFLGRALDPLYSLLPDYTVPLVENETITTILAVAIGALAVFAVALFIGRRLAPAAQRRSRDG